MLLRLLFIFDECLTFIFHLFHHGWNFEINTKFHAVNPWRWHFSHIKMCACFFSVNFWNFLKGARNLQRLYHTPKEIHSGLQSCMHYCLNETQTKLKKMKRRKKKQQNNNKMEIRKFAFIAPSFVHDLWFRVPNLKLHKPKWIKATARARGAKEVNQVASIVSKTKTKARKKEKINIRNRSWIDDEERNFKRKSTICTIHKWIVIWLCSDWCRLSATLCIFYHELLSNQNEI